METAISIFPFILLAFLLSAFLTYVFVLPFVPGTVVAKTPRNFAIAFIAALIQTAGTGGILLTIGIPALYIGVIIAMSGGLAAIPFWIGASFGLLVSVCSLIAFVCLKFAEFFSQSSLEFTTKLSKPLSALTLTLAQVLSGIGVLLYAENTPAETSAPPAAKSAHIAPPQRLASLPKNKSSHSSRHRGYLLRGM